VFQLGYHYLIHSINKIKKIIFLIGNKCDDTENRIVKLEDAMQFAKDNKLNYFETSAKTGKNIQKVFENLTLKIMEIYPPCETINSKNNIILDKKKAKIKKKEKKEKKDQIEKKIQKEQKEKKYKEQYFYN